MLFVCFWCGDIKYVEEVFNRMFISDLISCNVMLAGYVKAGELKFVKDLFVKMFIKDDVLWSIMIFGFV